MPRKIKLISGRELVSLLLPIGILISVPGASSKYKIYYILYFDLELNVRLSQAADTDSLTNATAHDRLEMTLFINTDVDEQPLYNDQPSTVSLGLAVNYMDINEMDGKITLHCWLSTVSRVR